MTRLVNPSPAGRIQSTKYWVGWVPRTDRANCLNPPEQGKGERLSTVGKSSSSWISIQRCQSNAELLLRGSYDKPTLLVLVRTVLLSRAVLLYRQPAPGPSPWGPSCCPWALDTTVHPGGPRQPQGAGLIPLLGSTWLCNIAEEQRTKAGEEKVTFRSASPWSRDVISHSETGSPDPNSESKASLLLALN